VLCDAVVFLCMLLLTGVGCMHLTMCACIHNDEILDARFAATGSKLQVVFASADDTSRVLDNVNGVYTEAHIDAIDNVKCI
jgi:hypothetical protein